MNALTKCTAIFTVWFVSTYLVVAAFLWMAGQFHNIHMDICEARIESARAGAR